MDQKRSFHVIEEVNMSLATPQELEEIFTLLQTHQITLSQITASQKLAIYGIEDENFFIFRQELFKILPQLPDRRIQTVRSCPSPLHCKYAMTDSQELAHRIQHIPIELPLPHKVKVGIAACRMCCTQPFIRDLGILRSKKGWTLVFGGNGGSKPRIADVIAEALEEDDVIELVKKCLTVYCKFGSPKYRTARFIEKFGIDNFKNIVLK